MPCSPSCLWTNFNLNIRVYSSLESHQDCRKQLIDFLLQWAAIEVLVITSIPFLIYYWYTYIIVSTVQLTLGFCASFILCCMWQNQPAACKLSSTTASAIFVSPATWVPEARHRHRKHFRKLHISETVDPGQPDLVCRPVICHLALAPL